MTAAFKTEQRQILRLQDTTAAKHFIGERCSHYYSVKTAKKLMCLVVYNRRNWATDDIPAYIVTERAARAGSAAECRLVDAMIAAYGPPLMPSVHVDFETTGTITEVKAWLDVYAETTRQTAVRVLDAGGFCARVNALKENDAARAAHRELDLSVAEMQREIANITATAGQNLITAYSHGTRPRGAGVWDTQYYNFPE